MKSTSGAGRTTRSAILHALAEQLRAQRLARGAVILPLPEIQVYVNAAGMIQVSRDEKETPSQIMVSEWMIAANGLAASRTGAAGRSLRFSAVRRECKPETDFTQSEHELFRIYRQRRLFARAELETRPRAPLQPGDAGIHDDYLTDSPLCRPRSCNAN